MIVRVLSVVLAAVVGLFVAHLVALLVMFVMFFGTFFFEDSRWLDSCKWVCPGTLIVVWSGITWLGWQSSGRADTTLRQRGVAARRRAEWALATGLVVAIVGSGFAYWSEYRSYENFLQRGREESDRLKAMAPLDQVYLGSVYRIESLSCLHSPGSDSCRVEIVTKGSRSGRYRIEVRLDSPVAPMVIARRVQEFTFHSSPIRVHTTFRRSTIDSTLASYVASDSAVWVSATLEPILHDEGTSNRLAGRQRSYQNARMPSWNAVSP